MSGVFSRRLPWRARRKLRLALSQPDSERLRHLLTERAARDAAHSAYAGSKPHTIRAPRRALRWLGVPIVAVARFLAWRWTG